MGAVLGALHASGLPHRRGPRDRPPGGAAGRSRGRDAAQAATRQAIADLLEPDRDLLRLPVDTLAEAFLRALFGRGDGRTADRRQLIDLFLYGAVRTADQR